MVNHYFPFDAMGFHCNPFSALTKDEWAAIAVLPSEILELIEIENCYLQLLGEAGHGKSTLLRGITTHFRDMGKQVQYEYLPLGQRHFKTPPAIIANLDIFLLDEAQRLTRRQRRKLFSLVVQHQVQLMMGCHEDFTPYFAKNGMSLSTVVLDAIDERVLGEMLIRRLDYFRTDELPKVYFQADAVRYLVTRFGRNLRHLEYYLYEVFQYLAKRQRIESISAALLAEIDPQIINPVEQE